MLDIIVLSKMRCSQYISFHVKRGKYMSVSEIIALNIYLAFKKIMLFTFDEKTQT